jgi:two-component system alkaline phosphatase synthesis response regulator PhoP
MKRSNLIEPGGAIVAPPGVDEVFMAKESLLVVEDEESILELLDYNLSKEGYEVSEVTSGEEAIEAARTGSPDLILLDLMLPGLDGFDVCRILKSDPKTKHIPIVMLTAKGEESDIVAGLELGADDYITKPFSPKVLVARIRAVLRRAPRAEVDDVSAVRVHDVLIHPGRHEVSIAGEPVDLTSTEFRILRFLAGRPGWVFTRDQIIESIHGGGHHVADRSIDVQIMSLRKKMGGAGRHIETVRGVGYRFKEQ